MVDKERNKCEQHLHYIFKQWNKIGSFGIINNISEHVALVQLMDSIGNVNHAVSVLGKLNFHYK